MESHTPLQSLERLFDTFWNAHWTIQLVVLAIGFYAIRGFVQKRQNSGVDMMGSSKPQVAKPSQGFQHSSPDLESRIRALLAAGNKVGAIKEYRDATGLGLKEAKDAVEAIERGRR